MNGEFQPSLVVLSWAVGVLAAAVFLHIARAMPDFSPVQRRRWRLVGGMVMGMGIWAMHFIGMLAFKLPIAITYHLGVTVASIVPAVVASFFVMWMLEKHQTGGPAMKGVRLIVAGAIQAGGIGAMHFSGMAAMQVQPGIDYHLVALALSLLCAFALSYSALWVATRPVRSSTQSTLATLALGSAIAGMHYVAMSAAHFAPNTICITGGAIIDTLLLAQAVAGGTLVLIMMAFVAFMFEHRLAQQNLLRISDLEQSNRELEGRARSLADEMVAEQRRAEARRDAMMETAEVNFFEVDVRANTISFVDKFLYLGGGRRLPLTSQSFDRSAWKKHLHPADIEDAQRGMDDYIAGMSSSYEAHYRIAVGPDEWRWVMARARVVEWTSNRRAVRLYGTLIDVHQNKLNQIALDEERQMLTTGPVVMVRVRWVKGNSRFVYVSANVVKLWGYDPDTLLNLQTSWSIVHPDDAERIRADFMKTMESQSETTLEVEIRLRMADGAYRWFRYNSMIDRQIGERKGYFIDIDARKQAELEAATQRQRLQETVLQLEAAQGEGGVLQDTGDMLHATEDLAEAFNIIKLSALRLFPGWSGWIAASRDGGNELTIGAEWGTISTSVEKQFNGRDCWGMRRGKPHAFFNYHSSVCCPHMQSVPVQELRPYICVPMAAHGEVVGALHLFCESYVPTEQQMVDVQSRASRFAETLKLALSNLKLRTSLQDQAMSDGLTGLYNRRYMDEALVHELQRARRDQRPVSLAMIDVDHFKRFNDQYGHDAGDAVLRAIGAVLQENIRGYDIACRYGGEELALILPGCDVTDAEARVQQVRFAVESMHLKNSGQDLPTVTISVGVAHAIGGSSATLIRRADEALYEAKRQGRNRVVVSQAAGLSAVNVETAPADPERLSN